MNAKSARDPISVRKCLIATLITIAVSPVFGVILADIIDYHEPLDIAAEALHLPDLTESINWTPFIGYTVPGLTAETGYFVAGLMGVGVILGLGYIFKRLVG